MIDQLTFLKYRSKIEIVHFFAILILALYPVLPYAVVSISIFAIVLSSLFLEFNRKVNVKVLIIQVSFYALLLVSLLYSNPIFSGIKELKSNAVILVFPIIFLLFKNPFLNKNVRIVFLVYIIANLGLIYVLFDFFSNGIVNDRFPNLIEEGIWAQLKYLWSYPFEFVLSKSLKGASSWFMNHKTILALNFLIAALLSLKLLFNDFKSSKLKYLLIIPLKIFVICIVYTQSLINVALLPLLLLYAIIKIKKKRLQVGLIIFVLTISTLVYIKLDISEAFNNGNTKSVITMVKNMFQGEINGDSEPRLFIYYCDVELIKSNFLIGYGIGDVQNQLNQCYTTHQFEAKVNKERVFNSHNYYAHLILSAGIFAFLLFVYMFIYNGKIAFNNKDYAYLLFLLIIAINLLTDNILLRFQGAVCFALFNSLFLISNLKLKNE